MPKKTKKLEQQEQPKGPDKPLRRVKVVSVDPIILEDWLKQGNKVSYEVVEDGLPKDAKMEGVRYDAFRGMIDFLYESKEFEEVEDGAIPPQLQPVLRTLPQT